MANVEPRSGSRRNLAVVTGASSGIGAATSRELAERGYHVLAGVRRTVDADALRAKNIEPILLDITDETGIAALAERVRTDPEGGRLVALVNNAGVGVNAPVETYALQDWRRLFEVNLFGHVAVIQALLPALIESGGTIVNVSSVGGRVAMAGYGPYACTKFALEALSDSLRAARSARSGEGRRGGTGCRQDGMLGSVGAKVERVIETMTPHAAGSVTSRCCGRSWRRPKPRNRVGLARGGWPHHRGRRHQPAAADPLHRWPLERHLRRLDPPPVGPALDRLLATGLRPHLSNGAQTAISAPQGGHPA